MIRWIAALTALTAPAAALAQNQCPIPSGTINVRPDVASAEQPRRLLPIGGYTLAVSWSPNYCRTHSGDAARFQCASRNRFGFVLHGLWPDGIGKEWPQYCKATPLVARTTIRRTMCATPSAQLIQHEWAKHGTCMTGYTPARYFATSTTMFARLKFPDMDALSRRPLNAGQFAQAFARANPGLRADMLRVTADRQGWLDEVWLCQDKAFRYQRCPAHQGGLADNAVLKVWRGRR